MTSTPVAFVTGITGQDGTYLAEALLARGYEVHGLTRAHRGASDVPAPVTLHIGEITDRALVHGLVGDLLPTQVFHLAAVSSVFGSWQDPVGTAEANGMATAFLLDACLAHQERSGSPVAMVNASSAEIFAGSGVLRQAEDTPLSPTSPYGAAKTLAHTLTQMYRSKGLAASNAILYNHESPRRPTRFVTRKISSAVASIATTGEGSLVLGNLAARRDWGWAPDYVDGLLRIADHGSGEDFVLATGVSHSVEDFVAAAFAAAGVADWRPFVSTDAEFTRSGDAPDLVGDAGRARERLGWAPTLGFEDIVAAMVHHDLDLLKQDSRS